MALTDKGYHDYFTKLKQGKGQPADDYSPLEALCAAAAQFGGGWTEVWTSLMIRAIYIADYACDDPTYQATWNMVDKKFAEIEKELLKDLERKMKAGAA